MSEKPENPKTTHFEFGGIYGTHHQSESCSHSGAPFMLVLLPLTTYGLYYICPGAEHCTPFEIPPLPSLESLLTAKAAAVFVLWFLFQAILYIVLPGEVG